MPRPLKNPADRKDTYIRIPVTAAQKAQMQASAEAAGKDLAPWAREILLAYGAKKPRRDTERQ